MKLHLVDATFELFRAFYSRPPRRAPDGRPVNAVQGLIDSMLSLLREPDVTHIGAATDYVIESWRNDVFPGLQVERGHRSATCSRSSATRSARSTRSGCRSGRWSRTRPTTRSPPPSRASPTTRGSSRSIICSVDKDLAQLVDGERIVLRDRMRRVTYDEAGVIAKFGVEAGDRSPTTSRSSATAATASPACRAGARRARPPCSRSSEHLEAIPPSVLDWELDIRNASRLAATLAEQRDERDPLPAPSRS